VASPAQRIAVVDFGSNSTRLLVADVRNGKVDEIERRTEITRLGEGVDASGRLDPGAVDRVFRALEEFSAAFDRLGAEQVVGVATSAVRDAENGEELRAAIDERFGVEARILSGEEEARLTFRGATSARSMDDASRGHGGSGSETTLVIDIGGGSTELVVGEPGGDPHFHVSTDAGSVRQTERHLAADPPEQDDVSTLALEVQTIVEEAVPEGVRSETYRGVAVAGTATSLAAVDQELEPYDPARVEGYPLELAACERMLAMFAVRPLEQRRKVPGLHPGRAPTIVAGTAILVEVMRAFGLEVVETSEADILHGAALHAATSR
jgi:exopolyphosphatase / guanosine-5'-triphosphate,3'-diphosphate pyrophosphatase